MKNFNDFGRVCELSEKEKQNKTKKIKVSVICVIFKYRRYGTKEVTKRANELMLYPMCVYTRNYRAATRKIMRVYALREARNVQFFQNCLIITRRSFLRDSGPALYGFESWSTKFRELRAQLRFIKRSTRRRAFNWLSHTARDPPVLCSRFSEGKFRSHFPFHFKK